MFDLFFFFKKITPFSPVAYVYPKTAVFKQLRLIQGINRSWGYGEGYIETNLQTYEKVFSPNGYNAISIRRYGDLIASSYNRGKIPNSIPADDVNLPSGYGVGQFTINPYRQRLMNLLGVKYVTVKNNLLTAKVVADTTTFPEESYKLIWQDAPWQIYQNLNSLPRFFLAGNYIVRRNQGIINAIYNPKIKLRKTLILEQSIPVVLSKKESGAAVKLVNYSDNKVVFREKKYRCQIVVSIG